MRNLGQLNDLPSKVIPQQRLRHTVELWACDCWGQPLPKISLECLHWCNNAQQCSTMFKNMQPSSYAVKLCHIMSLLYTVVVSANEPHDLQWLEVCGSRRGDYLFLRTSQGGQPMCRSWSQIEPNWAKFSTSVTRTWICDDLWCALCNVHFWNVHFALHFESLNLSLFEEDPAAWPVERRQAWANCCANPQGMFPPSYRRRLVSVKHCLKLEYLASEEDSVYDLCFMQRELGTWGIFTFWFCQEFLSKSFGFRCNCHRCIEEAVPEVPRSINGCLNCRKATTFRIHLGWSLRIKAHVIQNAFWHVWTFLTWVMNWLATSWGGWQPNMMMRWESAERMADPWVLVGSESTLPIAVYRCI